MRRTRPKSSLQKEQSLKLINKRSPKKISFVSKPPKRENATLKRNSSNARGSNNNSNELYTRKITDFFKSPKTQVSNSDKNSSNDCCFLIGFALIANNGSIKDEFEAKTCCDSKMMSRNEKTCEYGKYIVDKSRHCIDVLSKTKVPTNNMNMKRTEAVRKSKRIIKKVTCCDVPTYQHNIKDNDIYAHYVKKFNLKPLAIMLEDIGASVVNDRYCKHTPEKSPESYQYCTRSRSKSSSGEKRQYYGTPKKPKCTSGIDANVVKNMNCEGTPKKSPPSSSREHHGYQLRSRSSNSQSPQAVKRQTQVRNKTRRHRSPARQRKSPKTKLTNFFERTPRTKQKSGSKFGSPKKVPTEKIKRKLDFQKAEDENCDQLSNISNKKVLESKKTNSSFDRYGIYVPSYQDILNEKKKYDTYIELVDSLTKLVVPLPKIEIKDYNSPSTEIKVLNCKHMSKADLLRAYANNSQYIYDIVDGKIISERHEKYKSIATREELTYNTSMITFTNEQKQLLVTKLCEEYGDTSAHSDYYFKVLLPELCLKIFMDEHSMSREEATEYLDCYVV